MTSKSTLMAELVRIRKASGITQTELAHRLDINQSNVSHLERTPDNDLTIGRLNKYLKALRVINISLSLNVLYSTKVPIGNRMEFKWTGFDDDVEKLIQKIEGEK